MFFVWQLRYCVKNYNSELLLMIQIFIFKLTLSRFLNSFKIFLKSVPPNFIWLSCWIESLSLQIFYYKKKKKKKQIKNFFFGIAKSCIHLHPVPPTSIQPISASTQLHPQRYTNQNIARNWEISPNLGQKIQSYPLCLKISSTLYLRGDDSESEFRLTKIQP